MRITVVGIPAPQGSKKGFVVKGKVVMAESSKKVAPWRQDVKAAALKAIEGSDTYPLTGPVHVTISFLMPRPGYHFRTGARASELKPNAPTHVDKKPDVDKLLRSTFDALGEAGVWRDDAQVASLTVAKAYANGHPGAVIDVAPVPVEVGA